MEANFKKRFSLSKDYLEPADLNDLVLKMELKDYSNEKLKKLYDELDIKNEGKVLISKFISTALDKSTEDNEFYNQLILSLTSKGELVLHKLKKLKELATFANDIISQREITWICNNITSNLFEVDAEKLLQRGSADQNKIAPILQYSQALTIKAQSEDLQSLNNPEQKQRSMNCFKKKSIIRMPTIFNYDKFNQCPLNDFHQQEIAKSLEYLSSFNFDIFIFDLLSAGQSLHFILNHIFQKHNLYDVINEKKYNNFIVNITKGYNRKVPYHNDLHGADVLQTVYNIIYQANVINLLELTIYDVISIGLAAACHDFKHNGFNNSFHINDFSDIAINYNDVSVLENYHVSETFKVMLKLEDNDLLCNLNKEQFRHVRRRIIDSILATDMANHSKNFTQFKTLNSRFEIKNGENIKKVLECDSLVQVYKRQQTIINIIIHSADISNPTKPLCVYDKWVDLLFQEFFSQGDVEKEKNLPISPLCDRETTSLPKSQIGFINFVVSPTFDELANLLPPIKPYIMQMQDNLNEYSKRNDPLNKK